MKKKCIKAKYKQCKGKITFAPDPYDQDINGNSKKVWECEYHREQSSMDI